MFDGGPDIGSATCWIGYISKVNVVKKAQNCGIAKVLTTLCLIDKDLNGKHGNLATELKTENEALERFEDHFKKEYDWVTLKCKSLWALLMLANPKSGGFAYFNAALDSGFQMMFVEDKNPNKVFGPESTERWKSLYDPKKGDIKEKTTIPAFDRYWHFCKLK